MDFISLCMAVARESGTLASLPVFATVTGATGRTLKLVNWTRDAYTDLQNQRADWLWLRKTFSKALTIGNKTYTAASLDVTRFGAWLPDRPDFRTFTLYDPATGQSDEGEISQISYDLWRMRYDRGTHDANRPTEWAISPQRELLLGTMPDKAYVLRGEYRASPQTLTLDADVPEMPDAFHRVIVFEALRLMARADEAMAALNIATDEYRELRNALVIDQTAPLDMEGYALA